MSRHTVGWLALPLALVPSGCIRARNYHPDISPQTKSTFHYEFAGNEKNYGAGYFENTSAYEAYVEFDARGSMYRDRNNQEVQLNQALNLIHQVRFPNGGTKARKMALYIFVHGWKNNASEQSGDVWGYRRFLSDIAFQHQDEPVVGIYIGWPGASLKNDLFLSFWNREPVADNVGSNIDMTNALRKILKAVKGEAYYDDDHSTAVVIGHSFGGIVLEKAATNLLKEQLASGGDSPADLFVLLNEAGAAIIARPFLYQLHDGNVTYNDGCGRPHPLFLSMTSVGDIATKFAYPGGEFFSINRSSPPAQYSPPDLFGQTSELPYDLLTAANMVALQSHQIVPYVSGQPCDLKIGLNRRLQYCMNALTTGRLNQTPYWIMQLPQTIVPDHSDVFQAYLLKLFSAVLEESRVTNNGPRKQAALPATCDQGGPRLSRQ